MASTILGPRHPLASSPVDEADPTTGAAMDERHRSSRSPPPQTPFGSYPPAGAGSSTINDYLRRREEEREHARAQKHKRSRSSSNVSSLLLAATERLGQETNRANDLETRCTEVLSRLKTVVSEREELRRDLAKTSEELRLYKMQLDFAQKEINRAQAVVEGVDKARQEAEEQAARDRTIARRLVSERAVWVAREEGRSEGFKEGLRRGRRWAYEVARQQGYDEAAWQYAGAGEAGEEYEDEYTQEAEEYSPSTPESSSPSSRNHWSAPMQPQSATHGNSASTIPPHAMSQAPTIPSTMAPSRQSRHPSRSDNAAHNHQQRPASRATASRQSSDESAPRSTRSRSRPRALPQTPGPARASSPPPASVEPTVTERGREARPETRMSNHSEAQAQARVRARSPSVARSQRSTVIPPDGFIPVVGPGADSVITLPAPHSLSRPVSMVGDPDDHEREYGQENANAGTSTGRERAWSAAGRATSRASTRMSEFDLLQPPPRQTDTPITHRIVREWRAANSNEPRPEQRQAPRPADVLSTRTRSSTTTTLPSQVHSRRSAQTGPGASGPPPGAPRRPREIVMPMPLSATMFGAGISNHPNIGIDAGPTRTRAAQQNPIPLTSAFAYANSTASANGTAAALPTRPATTGPVFAGTTAGNNGIPSVPAGQVQLPEASSSSAAATGQSLQPPQNTRPKSAQPFAWLRRRMSQNRSFSASSVPQIQVEPPSNPASDPSTGVIADSALLAADDTTAPLPQQFVSVAGSELAGALAGLDSATNNLPQGFVPQALSPILPGLRIQLPSGSPQPPAYTLQAEYTPPPGSSMHSEMGSAPVSAVSGPSIASAMLAQARGPRVVPVQ
ncbi:hypothetical protein MKEN_00118800 [Mycena kentingensis (nom. inval.)]|nr:hypothetical protein MKEN_00118800 [Mycena kentingensis (nom. inval.)]